MVGVPGAASRVFDELAALALDPAPGTRARTCPQKRLDKADAIIEGPRLVHGLGKKAADLEGAGLRYSLFFFALMMGAGVFNLLHTVCGLDAEPVQAGYRSNG